jgi:RHS repeat-associated protein
VEHNNGVHDDGARAWYQTFDYDRYGNRGINVENTSDNVDAANSALKLADFSGANNRITRAGFVYDAAGNLIEETGKRYTYDAENRIVMATVEGGAASQYVYDGNGRRVRKVVVGVGTRFEYGVGGELMAEWNDADSPNKNVQKDYFYKGGELFATKSVGSSEYQFATSDQLGSPRAWTDGSGNLVAGGRHDYLPFGEELFPGYGVRTIDQVYAANTQQDGQRKQFGSKERDIETGLDFFEARYFGSTMGRFTSPDPVVVSARRMVNPQVWNGYSYVGNNPLNATDPTGEELVRLGQHTDEEIKQRQKQIDQEKKALKQDKSLSKDEGKEKEKALNAEKNTLNLEKEGNRVVGAFLKALDGVGQRNGLSLSDFTLTTDTKNDFGKYATSDALKTLLNDQAFVIQSIPQFSGTIYIRTQSVDGFYQLSQQNPDYVYYGATAVRHEQEHLLGRGEGPAYRVQDGMMHHFQNSFQNRELYKDLDEALHDAIKKHP